MRQMGMTGVKSFGPDAQFTLKSLAIIDIRGAL